MLRKGDNFLLGTMKAIGAEGRNMVRI